MQPSPESHEIVLASNNHGKLREIEALLAPAALQLIPQGQLGIEAAEEAGLTFVENAILKARHAARASGRAAIADDSGIEVDALDGAPGIYSARYAGPDSSDQANCDKLLAELAARAGCDRSARFQCVMVYLRHASDPTPLICQGTWEGLILDAPRGENGFGYDPIFGVPTHGLSSAELDPETKNALSHRGQALRALVANLLERPTPYNRHAGSTAAQPPGRREAK
ncbi:RdgB/HAM1 family non-canonical purine NTP pyrophosphatase [Halochromatium glycolicum]|uniref:dITP/XTP pyrophosphatase n=1 Tax=Halochromatium glycolicum TaxID=85075 RepID=A0AAJ0U6I8_9GAMM|nr:RdgB/HAM1 family non-canonical purine NTP pyrophosphatase [Halochromatium glycolicum]MBK1706215.1 non-canonical purine NTP pyrophosphatase, RdgB/HAM1 family [Halochromatium glycolicum]